MTKSVARLYEQFQPENYQLHLIPDRQAMTFRGTVSIRGKKTGRPSQRLTFHQKELKITAAQIIKHDKDGEQTLPVSRINLQNRLNEVRLHSDSMLYPGSYTVRLEFTGAITPAMNGIYPCYFKHKGQAKRLIATQFESHHAREAFPCIDEPAAKATFDLTLTAPAGETVLANTPARTQLQEGEFTTHIFETTPRMSTYLLAFVYGEMAFQESKTASGTVVRAYATADNVALTVYSLDVAIRVLEFFEAYFDVPYPLPKLDMVALPDFSSGAMENWGLITYRETAMLADPKTSSIESQQTVALVVAHELSHQWFGNLVTMKWWDDLWLNESFANLMEYLAVDALYPEWRIWEQFVAHESTSAKRRDSLADVQPVRTGVNHPDEISTLFDPSIVYAKGGTVLHMLLHYIGEKAFRRGLKIYFDSHRYGNTAAADLWMALSAASDKDVDSFMQGWLARPGYPLVTLDWQPGSASLTLAQQRFLSDPEAAADSAEPWQVPLASSLPLQQPLLITATAETSLTAGSQGPLLLNHDGRSYFVPCYKDPAHRQQIVQGLKQHQVSDIDRYLLLDNYIMLQRGGLASTTDLLDLLRAFEDESNETVWGAIAMSLAEARRLVEQDEAVETKLDGLIQALVLPLATSLGWDDQPDDSPQTRRLRGLALGLATGARARSFIDEGLQHFSGLKKPGDLSASSRSVVYYCAARYGSNQDFERLLSLYSSLTNADEKDEIAGGLTGAKDQPRYQKLIKLLQTDTVRRQDVMHWYAWLLRNRYSRLATWQWMKDSWGWIENTFSSDKSYGYFARYAGSVFSREPELQDFRDFFEPKKSIVALSRDIALAEQDIASRVAWRHRNENAVTAWLKISS